MSMDDPGHQVRPDPDTDATKHEPPFAPGGCDQMTTTVQISGALDYLREKYAGYRKQGKKPSECVSTAREDECELYFDVLRAIAAGDCDDPRAVAKAVVKAREVVG